MVAQIIRLSQIKKLVLLSLKNIYNKLPQFEGDTESIEILQCFPILCERHFMAKKVMIIIKVNLKAGEATPAPPLGTALGPHGVNIMEFVKAYNDKTQESRGQVVPAVITIFEDRSFEFELKKAPVSEMIKKTLKLQKGSGTTPRETVGTLSDSQVTEIAKDKMDDLNTENIDQAKKIVVGTARSMGVKVETK